MRLRILITSSYYWPEPTGTAPYVTGMAEHYRDQGHDVTVATAFPHYPAWVPPQSRRLHAAETHNGVLIRRRWNYVPRSQSAARRALYELTLLAPGLTALERQRPHVVLGVTPSLAGAVLASVAAKVYRRPHGLLFHDLMGRAAAQSGVRGGGGVAEAVAKIERGLARRASAVAVYAEGFRRYFEEGGVEPARVARVRPWTLRDEPTETVDETRARFGWGPREFVCLHAGNMGQKQGLDAVLDAARLCGDPDVRFVLAGEGNDRARLEDRAGGLGLSNVTFIGSQPWGKFESMLRAADALIVNQRPSVGDMSFPSKLTSYFPAGRPLVASVSPDGETAEEVRSSGAGVVVAPDDPAALAQALVELKADPSRATGMGERGRFYADERLTASQALVEYDRFLAKVLELGASDSATVEGMEHVSEPRRCTVEPQG